MRIDIVADMACPWCYIGKRRLEKALQSRPLASEPEIGWQPFQINPNMPAGGMERTAYLEAKYGAADRARRHYGAISRAGREENIDFRFDLIRRTPNTVNSHRLIHFAGSHGLQNLVVEGLFRAYFTQGRDIGDVQVLAAIGAEAGLAPGDLTLYLESGKDSTYISREGRRIRDLGVTAAPCFVIGDRYAVSGAQAPEIFHQIFDLVREERNSLAAAAE